MTVQDIPENFFEGFRAKNEKPLDVEYDDDHGHVEKWHIAKLNQPVKGVICWYETTCLGNLPVSFLLVFSELCPEDVKKECTKKYRSDFNYLIKIRCGPTLNVLQNRQIVEDDVFISIKRDGLSLKCELFPLVINIMSSVGSFWPMIKKRIYP